MFRVKFQAVMRSTPFNTCKPRNNNFFKSIIVKKKLKLTIYKGICTVARKMTSFRESENIIVLYD